MRIDFGWPAYSGNGRADVVDDHVWARKPDSDQQMRRLYICGPTSAAEQIREVAENRCFERDVPKARRESYSHCFEFPDGFCQDVDDLVGVLRNIRTLRARPHLDYAWVLDWYKVPEDGVDGTDWLDTRAGDLVNRGKYRHSNVHGRELAKWMADTIAAHPLMAGAETVLTVPGSAADGRSFGERLARTVAKLAGKPLEAAESVGGARPARKTGEGPVDLQGSFRMTTTLDGTVLIVDDVYRSGESMGAVAYAARLAGADTVYGFAAAKTMRN